MGFRLYRSARLEHSFALSTALLVLVLTGATMFLVHSRLAGTLRAGLQARGFSIARAIGAVAAPALLAYNYPALQIAAEAACQDEGVVYAVIHDKEGNVAGAAGDRAALPGRAVPLGELPSARGSREVAVGRADGHWGTALELVSPVFVEGVAEPWGIVRLGMAYEPVRRELQRIDLSLLVLGAALATGAVACGRWMARRITAPLRQLAEASEALAQGDLSRRIPVQGAQELADLARSFNVMIERLDAKARESQAFQRALEELNATLEQQVRERTRALEESEAQYKTLVEHSPDSILIVQRGQVRFVNSAFLETFGLSPQEVFSPTFDLSQIFDASSAALARGRIAAWERGEPAGTLEVLGRDRAGGVRHLELRGSQIDYRGEPAAECLLVDMTEARRLRERLADTEKLRALGELAGGVAHDFNNLLSAILGRVQLLRRRTFDAETDRALEVIEKAARDGRETVLRIQEFSRVRRDRPFAPVDMGEVLRDSVEITRSAWQTEAQRRNVSIAMHLDLQEPVPKVAGNAAELREVFTNLILNAVDAMPQGGSIRIACRAEGERVQVEVRDTGVGMTEEVRRHVFDPFFTTKGQSGVGLGLSVVYGIVTRHGGTIDVETALGQGTAFKLEFPVAGDVQVAEISTSEPQRPAPGRVLVIDDEREVAEVLRDLLAAEGHAVHTATRGAEGVRLARTSGYDLIFTDLGMPDLSGWEVARQIREHAPEVPIVLVTGWGASLEQSQVREAGIAAVIHKPFDLDEVLRLVARLVDSQRARPAGPSDRRTGASL